MSNEKGAGMLVVEGVSKRYDDVVAAEDISFEVSPGAFLTLLGPSGSGKTTTLNVIAGFLAPESGRVLIDGDDITAVPPHRRDIGVVFQSYALFPHMTAAENVAFPLRARRVPRDEVRERVQKALATVQLVGHADRHAAQLSGGQQQRVALARAIVFQPRLLLMDEPLGALDKNLREAMQLEIVSISRRLGMTVVYVTHDQEEALVMSDQIAVYDGGRIQQLATPTELYERPGSQFVAEFLGESNCLRGRVDDEGGRPIVVHEAGPIRVDPAMARDVGGRNAEAVVVVRPERVKVLPAEPAARESLDEYGAVWPGVVRDVIYLGSSRKLLVDLERGGTLIARANGDGGISPGDRVRVGWAERHGVVIPTEREVPA